MEVTEDSHPCSSERAATESMLEVLTSQGSRIVHHAHQSRKTYLKVCNSKAEVLLRIGKFSSDMDVLFQKMTPNFQFALAGFSFRRQRGERICPAKESNSHREAPPAFPSKIMLGKQKV